MKFHGIIPPHVTPFTQEGDLDLISLDKLLDFWLEAKVHGLATCASNGAFVGGASLGEGSDTS